jgi:hypothetical protein
MKLKRIFGNVCLFVAAPVIVTGIALFMLLFGDPIDDDLGGDY